MTSRSPLIALIALAGSVVLALSVQAQSLARYEDQARFDGWTVTCDTLDDMGGITYIACVARSDGGLFVAEGAEGLMVRAPEVQDGDLLRVGGAELALAPCRADWCVIGVDLLRQSDAVFVVTSARETPVMLDGLDAALAAAARLVD